MEASGGEASKSTNSTLDADISEENSEEKAEKQSDEEESLIEDEEEKANFSDDTSLESIAQNAPNDESASDEDESYVEDSEHDSMESSSSTISYEEVPDAFTDYIPGPNAIEFEEKHAEKLFVKTQECLQAWNLSSNDDTRRDAYFHAVHDLMMNPTFARMRKNPYTLDWNSARRMEDRLTYSPVLKFFYSTHFQLTHLVHNSVPHYLQMLALTPSRTEMWYKLGAKAVELGDWKNAEFAYRKYMFFSGDKTKALQNIILLHYVSGDFLKAITVLKDLIEYQPNNAVAHVICREIRNMKGPWSSQIDSILAPFGVCKTYKFLAQDKIDWVMEKICKFRQKLAPKCYECLTEFERSAQSVQHLLLEEKDVLFYNFGKHLLTFYKNFLNGAPNALIFVGFPLRIEVEEPERPLKKEITDNGLVEKKLEIESSSITIPSPENTPKPVEAEPSTDTVKESLLPPPPQQPEQQSSKCKEVPVVIKNASGDYLQILDFLIHLAGIEQFERGTGLLCGVNGIAYIFDRLLLFVLEHFTATAFKHHKLDCLMFRKLYQQWYKLIKSSSRFKSADPESIHLFAVQLGVPGALKRLDKAVRQLFRFLDDYYSVSRALRCKPAKLNKKMDVAAEVAQCPRSPSFKRMVQTYEKLKLVSSPSLSEDTGESSQLTSNQEEIRSLRVLPLYLSKLGYNLDFDLGPPEYLETLRLDTDFDVFSTSRLSVLTKKQLYFLISYHFEKAKFYRESKTIDQLAKRIDKFIEYRHLLTPLKIVDFYLSGTDFQFDSTVISWQQFEASSEIQQQLADVSVTFKQLETATKRILELCKGFKRDQIESLIVQFEQGEDSGIDVLTNLLKCYDSLDVTIEEKLKNYLILYKGYKARKDADMMFDILSRTLQNLLEKSELRKPFLLVYLDACLTEVESDTDVFPKELLDKLSHWLRELTEKSFYRNRISLWITYYKVARAFDPQSKDEFCELFNETKVDHRLPTKSLSILEKAHSILSEEKSCMKDGGKFLQFYFDELLTITYSTTVQEALNDSDVFVNDIYKKVDREVMQVLNCLYNLEFPARFAKTHEHADTSTTFAKLDWDLSERVLSLFLPDELPVLSGKDNMSTELTELLNRFQPIIEEPLTDELRKEFEDFLDQNKNFRPDFHFNASSQVIRIDSGHAGPHLLEWPYPKDVPFKRREHSARVLYLLTFREFKAPLIVDEEKSLKVRQMAKNALLFGSDTLSSDLFATLWTIIAVNMNFVLNKPDLELFKMMGCLFFPNYMAILMKNTLAETHLDLATVFYKVITRFRRYLANTANTDHRPEIEATITELLSKAKTHFHIAHAHRHDNFEIGWSSNYFMAKIAEKQDAPFLEIIENYRQCAQLMEENFQFLKRVSKTEQQDFEPLELYYSIHSFLNKRRARSNADNNYSELRKVVCCLELFSEKHISRTDAKTPNFSVDLPAMMERVDRLAKEELMEGMVLDESITVVRRYNLVKKYNSHAEGLCRHAFEKILSLFPHYKAAYRLAHQLAYYKKYKDAADLLFKELFPVKNELNEHTSMFKQFVEIENSSFYYSGVLDYHLNKVIQLLNECLEKTGDVKGVCFVLNSLLKLHHQRNKKPTLSANLVSNLVEKTLERFGQTLSLAFANRGHALLNSLFFIRGILFEIDKQLQGCQFPFSTSFHDTITILKQQWLATYGSTSGSGTQPTA